MGRPTKYASNMETPSGRLTEFVQGNYSYPTWRGVPPPGTPSLKRDLEALLERDKTLDRIRDSIPMHFLQQADEPGVTGPTAALDLVKAVKLMVDNGRRLVDRVREHENPKEPAT